MAKTWEERKAIMNELVKEGNNGLKDLASKIRNIISADWPGAFVGKVHIEALNSAPVRIEITTSTIMGTHLYKLWLWKTSVNGVHGTSVHNDFYDCPTVFDGIENIPFKSKDLLKDVFNEIFDYTQKVNKNILSEVGCQPGLEVTL